MSRKGKRTVEPSGYREYIQSPAWQVVRKRYFASKLPKECYVCDKRYRPGFHLHHRTYKNLGNERLMDLLLLCPFCHEDTHGLVHGGTNLWVAAKRLKKKIRRGQKLLRAGTGSKNTEPWWVTWHREHANGCDCAWCRT